jgi:hypothetical protein
MKQISQKLLAEQHWPMLLESLSPQQRSILITLGRRAMSASSIAVECMSQEPSIDAQLRRLKADGLVEDTSKGLFAISVPALRDEAEKQRMCGDRKIDQAEVLSFIENEVYQTVVRTFEFLEHQQLIHGNGHDMAQNLASVAKQEIVKRWIKS